VRLPLLRRAPGTVAGPGIVGVARVDRRTKNLTTRLRPGDIAVIDHTDLDQVAAESLVTCRPAVVLNAAQSISGRYPNLGPQTLIDAGVPLIDGFGAELMTAVREGEPIRISEGVVYRGDAVVVAGTVQDLAGVTAAMDEARAGLAIQLESFVTNTLDYLQRERALLLDGARVPPVRTKIDGRPVLIVVRGHHYREDLATLRPYIRENRPVLIGVDGGADAILEAGYTPHLVVGDMDSVSDRALTCGAEIVVHAYRDGRAPGLERVRNLGINPVVFAMTGTSEDVAMLLADDRGASVIVAVGSHNNLEEFLDKGRAGMASTWLIRLRVGGKLVDAKGVSRLYRQRISNGQLTMLLLAGLVAVATAMASTPKGQILYAFMGARLNELWAFVSSFFVDARPAALGGMRSLARVAVALAS
jgi:uncharacterized membrane-anchored protein